MSSSHQSMIRDVYLKDVKIKQLETRQAKTVSVANELLMVIRKLNGRIKELELFKKNAIYRERLGFTQIAEMEAEYSGLLADYHAEIDKRHGVQALLKDRELVLMANKEAIANLQAENENMLDKFSLRNEAIGQHISSDVVAENILLKAENEALKIENKKLHQHIVKLCVWIY